MLLELHLENYSNIVRGNYSSHTQDQRNTHQGKWMQFYSAQILIMCYKFLEI